MTPHALGWAECSFPGTQTHRNCFQCYFYFAKINSKLLKDPFSRSKLEMAIIPQACGTSCCAELPRAFQGISAQAVPSIRQTFTGALLATAEGIAAGALRFTGSHGGTDVLVWLTKDRVLLAVCPTAPWDSSTQLHSPTHSPGRISDSQSPATEQEAQPGVMEAQPSQPQPSQARRPKGNVEGQPHALTWTGPMLLFLPPGMPSSLIAARHNQSSVRNTQHGSAQKAQAHQ